MAVLAHLSILLGHHLGVLLVDLLVRSVALTETHLLESVVEDQGRPEDSDDEVEIGPDEEDQGWAIVLGNPLPIMDDCRCVESHCQQGSTSHKIEVAPNAIGDIALVEQLLEPDQAGQADQTDQGPAEIDGMTRLREIALTEQVDPLNQGDIEEGHCRPDDDLVDFARLPVEDQCQ